MKSVPLKKRMLMSADDEAAVTDIRIAPDGRVFVFGTSRTVLEMFSELGWGDAAIEARIHALQQASTERETQQIANQIGQQESGQ